MQLHGHGAGVDDVMPRPGQDDNRQAGADHRVNSDIVPFAGAQTTQAQSTDNANRATCGSIRDSSPNQEQYMTLTLNKTHTADAASKTMAQDHHLKAAEHLDHASKSHREAAKLIEGGDHHAASSQAKLAAEHTAHAAHHVIEAAKNAANQSAVKK
jgi:hypothetical protein